MMNNIETAKDIAEHYYDNYGEMAYEILQKEVQKLSNQFDMLGYTSEELAYHKKLKQALIILKDYE